ncbi:Oidioi.mRNA.OKI2018_I69.chr1.g688.t1.cds [Oikopleura dioica]|uniref:Oidioi.mRNA.OKI2018_I69.chr1.g688.t1.cds n=1 Tax=Oikopleura dioica TaxID=34765 RepID=A0ABN7SPA1_OIKDI|nr:Oidioi.mRNA.OKI2018_I69.chr1.g688.t1.cds [Oikopleura dioica]
MTEEEYHMQMATKDWTTIMSLPMLLLAIQIIFGLRQFVNPELLHQNERIYQTPSPRRMHKRFNSIRHDF